MALVLLLIISVAGKAVLTQPDVFSILPSPCDGRSEKKSNLCGPRDQVERQEILAYFGVPVASQLSVTALPSVARVSELLLSSMMFGGTLKNRDKNKLILTGKNRVKLNFPGTVNMKGKGKF